MSADNDGAKNAPPSGGPPPTISHTSLPDEVLKALQAIPFLKNIAPGMAKIFAETPIDGDTLLQIDSQEDLMIIMEGTGITNRQATLLQAKIKSWGRSPPLEPARTLPNISQGHDTASLSGLSGLGSGLSHRSRTPTSRAEGESRRRTSRRRPSPSPSPSDGHSTTSNHRRRHRHSSPSPSDGSSTASNKGRRRRHRSHSGSSPRPSKRQRLHNTYDNPFQKLVTELMSFENAERQQQAEQSVAQRITDVSRKTGIGRIGANVTPPNRLLNDLINKYEEGRNRGGNQRPAFTPHELKYFQSPSLGQHHSPNSPLPGATAHRMLSMTVAYMLGGQLEPAEAFNYLGVLFKIAADNDWAVAQKYDHTVRSQWSAGSDTDKNFVPDVGKLDLEALWTARRYAHGRPGAPDGRPRQTNMTPGARRAVDRD
ncbi:hypothetical protein FOZ60_010743 [Perkinsus olseni]|uniref:Uncharacterized protein n=1 Tax=Perkinsus olseni TaxID=32597 RepID=A0A7J6NEP7_PEROL|nr:hypothetical protein FOZ60_010743 [Perkinsus olseni]